MILFKCRVMGKDGKKIKIKYKTTSKQEVIEYLKQKNYIILDIKESKGINFSFKGKKKLTSKLLSVFCKQLSTLQMAGISALNSLEVMTLQANNKELKEVSNQLISSLQKGSTFSKSLIQLDEVFPKIFISMVEAGEVSGNLDKILELLSEHFDKEYKLENKVKSAMIYPILLMTVCMAVVIFFLIAIMPSYIQIYKDSQIPLPYITSILLNVSEIIKGYWYIVICLIVLIFIGHFLLDNIHSYKYTKHFLMTKIPIYKNMILGITVSKFAKTLSILLASGITILEALEIVSETIENSYIKKEVLEIKEDVGKGVSFSQSLQIKNIFPPIFQSMVRIGEDSGSLETVLGKVADYYNEEVDAFTSRLTTILEPILIIIVAFLVGIIVIAIVLPMFDMIDIVY